MQNKDLKKTIDSDAELETRDKKTLEDRIAKLEALPANQIVLEKIASIDRAIARVKKNTKPVHKGNKTMYQHLLELKAVWQNGGESLVEDEKTKVRAHLNKVNNRL